jgi:diacylglycerol kinase family enzyme
VNPTKFDDVAAVRRRITATASRLGWAEPLFILTTEKDTGQGQTHHAVEEGVALVCPLGGDGTVRAVASALAGTETPMGLLPGGTGNLLARNLDLPIDDLDDALTVALTGQNKRVDVGRLTVDVSGEHENPEEHIFLVMAGLGFDAAIMAGAPEKLKAKVGPAAYVVSGMKNLRGPQFRIRAQFDDGEEVSRRTRTVVIGNCGKLLGGLVLMPEAEVDDGQLDTVIISPQGVVGWAAVAARVASKRRKGHRRVDHYTSATVRLRSDRPQEVQLDGDPIGTARAISATVLPGALVVRVGSAP